MHLSLSRVLTTLAWILPLSASLTAGCKHAGRSNIKADEKSISPDTFACPLSGEYVNTNDRSFVFWLPYTAPAGKDPKTPPPNVRTFKATRTSINRQYAGYSGSAMLAYFGNNPGPPSDPLTRQPLADASKLVVSDGPPSDPNNLRKLYYRAETRRFWDYKNNFSSMLSSASRVSSDGTSTNFLITSHMTKGQQAWTAGPYDAEKKFFEGPSVLTWVKGDNSTPDKFAFGRRVAGEFEGEYFITHSDGFKETAFSQSDQLVRKTAISPTGNRLEYVVTANGPTFKILETRDAASIAADIERMGLFQGQDLQDLLVDLKVAGPPKVDIAEAELREPAPADADDPRTVQDDSSAVGADEAGRGEAQSDSADSSSDPNDKTPTTPNRASGAKGR